MEIEILVFWCRECGIKNFHRCIKSKWITNSTTPHVVCSTSSPFAILPIRQRSGTALLTARTPWRQCWMCMRPFSGSMTRKNKKTLRHKAWRLWRTRKDFSVPVLYKAVVIKHGAYQTDCVAIIVLEKWDSWKSGDCSNLGSASRHVYLRQVIFGCQAVLTIGGEEAGKITGDRVSGRGTRNRNILLMYLSLSVVSLFFDLQINPFRPSPIHPAFDSQPLRCSVNIFSPLSLFFRRGKEPLTAALVLGCRVWKLLWKFVRIYHLLILTSFENLRPLTVAWNRDFTILM
jgi:hypothetical protein